MTPKEAQQILTLYRPGTADAEDPEVIEAVAVARSDPQLARWFERHCAFQSAVRAKFRAIDVPPHLKLALRSPALKVPVPFWRNQVAWLAAAAVLALLAGGAVIWIQGAKPPEQLANFQARMVSTALREYRMDVVSPDMQRVRDYLASQGAPGDYEVTPGLQRLALTGGGVLRWRSNPVSMVCFEKANRQMLFLFVLDGKALKDPPPEKPTVSRVNEFVAASWTRNGRTYVLAGPEEPGFPEKYL